jgi:hypothetical protein
MNKRNIDHTYISPSKMRNKKPPVADKQDQPLAVFSNFNADFPRNVPSLTYPAEAW